MEFFEDEEEQCFQDESFTVDDLELTPAQIEDLKAKGQFKPAAR